ncbi:MAG TPA: hypothetical protein VME69_16280 [Methylocella sp.]|nr:hypothetical protein [Methylocella sp.]
MLKQMLERELSEKPASTFSHPALSPAQRMASSLKYPLIENELCISYSVRPLACRGHASNDKDACRKALAGRSCEVPISALQLTVRSLVQNALQSALRDAHLAWGCYELNRALTPSP